MNDARLADGLQGYVEWLSKCDAIERAARVLRACAVCKTEKLEGVLSTITEAVNVLRGARE